MAPRALVGWSVLALAACAQASPEARPAPASVGWTEPTTVASAPRGKAGAPLRVVGYPRPLPCGLPDPAQWAGYTPDGSFGYCVHSMYLRCELLDADGRATFHSAAGAELPFDEAKDRALYAWVADAGPPALPAALESGCEIHPPPVTGSWAWGEITLHLRITEGTPDGHPPVPSRVHLGGAVDGDAPVFPIALDAPSRHIHPADDAYGTVEVNLLALSADGEELGIVTHVNRSEYATYFEVRRLRTSDLAAKIYRASAEAARARGDLTRAAAYTERASLSPH